MRSRTQNQTHSKISEIEIGLEESAVVLVEAGDATGYLISKSYSIGVRPFEIALHEVIYLCLHGSDIRVAELREVMVSTRDGYWCAVETGEVLVIPCPAREPYPIIFISKHGYCWMRELIQNGNIQRVNEHLWSRFKSYKFATDRSILVEPSSPFRHVGCMG